MVTFLVGKLRSLDLRMVTLGEHYSNVNHHLKKKFGENRNFYEKPYFKNIDIVSMFKFKN